MNVEARRRRWIGIGLLGLGAGLFPLISLSIPLDMGTNLSKTLPPGIADISDPGVQDDLPGKTFVKQGKETNTVPVFPMVRPSGNDETNASFSLWTENTNEITILGRYAGRLYSLDLESLDDSLPDRERQALAPFRTDLFLQDLGPPVQKTNEMEQIMKDVAKTVAAQTSSTQPNDAQGVISAIMYLLMAAIVILVAIARR